MNPSVNIRTYGRRFDVLGINSESLWRDEVVDR
jgi:hypothetical protein